MENKEEKNTTHNEPRIFLDLDGVLANLVRAFCNQFNVDYPSDKLLDYSETRRALDIDPKTSPFEEFEETLEFWTTVPVFPYTETLVRDISKLGKDWYILSKPTHSMHSWSGKYMWVKNNLPADLDCTSRLILHPGDKSSVCRPRDILVDDLSENCDDWLSAGGDAFLWKPYGDTHDKLYDQMVDCVKHIKSLLGINESVKRASARLEIKKKLRKQAYLNNQNKK